MDCGRRMTEFGPWSRESGQDTWVTDRWTLDPEEDRREIEAYKVRNPGGSTGSRLWPGPGAPARTCSFCGGANPEDIIALMEQGWRASGTDKGYKAYLMPPTGHMPTPPVKVYAQHFTEEQVRRFNQLASGTTNSE